MVQLVEITWVEAENLFKETDVALLPVGSTEQHGPHNPLGTDYLVAAALCHLVGDRTSVPVLPAIPIGVSEQHRQFPGSLWVPPSIFRDYIKAVSLSVASHGTRKIVFVNGHGGNSAALMEIAGELRREHRIFAMMLMALPLAMMDSKSGHGGAEETSVNLYFHNALVKMEQAVNTQQRGGIGIFKIKGFNRIGPAQFALDSIDLTDTGILGRANEMITSKTASEEQGRKLMEPYIEEVCKFIEELKKADVKQLLSKPHK